jgi:hypothetical protein
MFCPNCGFRNTEGVGFCARCGASILAEQADAQTTLSYHPGEDERELAPLREDLPEGATLVIRSGGGRAGETYPLTEERTTLGRHPAADIFLDDVTVSRNHAVVEREGAHFAIADQGSLNGTYVNRRRIERHVLVEGDEVQVGKYKFTFIVA